MSEHTKAMWLADVFNLLAINEPDADLQHRAGMLYDRGFSVGGAVMLIRRFLALTAP